jgi:hypothetical protein
MHVDLSRQWNGQPAPTDAGGSATLLQRGGRLELHWDLGLLLPPLVPPGPAGFTERLWEWDVVELFLGGAAQAEAAPRYVELEHGPGGHWIALAFDGVRQRVAELRHPGPELHNESVRGRWRGRASWPLEPVLRHVGPAPWRGLVTAVIGTQGAERLHLGWPVLPGAQPDFHQPLAWAPLPLASPQREASDAAG